MKIGLHALGWRERKANVGIAMRLAWDIHFGLVYFYPEE